MNTIMINKRMVMSLLVGSMALVGCDKFKPKPQENSQSQSTEFSCTEQSHIQGLQEHLKQEYLKEIERRLRSTHHYEVDQGLLKTINDGLKFELKSIRTITQDKSKTSELECEAQLNVKFPKGLQVRAENAFLEQRKSCDECDYELLKDELEAGEFPLVLQSDSLKGNIQYDVLKTDNEGINLSINAQNEVINAVVRITQLAVQYEAYIKENAELAESSERYDQKRIEQMALAQKAMDIRKKEIEQDKQKVVERLNMTWDRFNDEQKAQLKQDQADWFEKRDVDCKVLAQKPVYDMKEGDLETYQKHYDYWDETMRETNQQMQYDQCFNQRTNERIVYLNNVFN